MLKRATQIWESGTSTSNHNLAISVLGMSLGYICILKEGTVHCLATRTSISFHLGPLDNNISEDIPQLPSCAETVS